MTINCKGKLLKLDFPIVMGILNLTPDSFFDGGRLKSDKEMLLKAEKMLAEGASILDVGGYSSRPNAQDVSVEEEIARTENAIAKLVETFPEIIISIDTFRSQVAEHALHAGAGIVNDISAGDLDENMWKVVKKHSATYLIMHMQGTPQNMQNKPQYQEVTQEVFDYLQKKITELRAVGIKDIIIDPGFGFGKIVEHNFELLRNLEAFSALKSPILVGISRKSMITKTLNTIPQNALNGTTALNMVGLQKGANILRVHDVKEAMECIQLHQALIG